MEDLLEVLIVIVVAVIGIASKSSKNKKKAADKPAKKPAPAAEPAKAEKAASVSDRKAINRRNVENAVKAFSELIDAKDGLPDPDKPAAVNFNAQTAIRDLAAKLREPTAIEAEASLKKRAEVVKARVIESLTGESPADEHGCIGGSMPDHSAEGESLAEHAAHERERSSRIAAESASVRAEDLRKPTARDLRRAVVMSEILDKPVALRKRSI